MIMKSRRETSLVIQLFRRFCKYLKKKINKKRNHKNRVKVCQLERSMNVHQNNFEQKVPNFSWMGHGPSPDQSRLTAYALSKSRILH